MKKFLLGLLLGILIGLFLATFPWSSPENVRPLGNPPPSVSVVGVDVGPDGVVITLRPDKTGTTMFGQFVDTDRNGEEWQLAGSVTLRDAAGTPVSIDFDVDGAKKEQLLMDLNDTKSGDTFKVSLLETDYSGHCLSSFDLDDTALWHSDIWDRKEAAIGFDISTN